jgi:hypothetical protein
VAIERIEVIRPPDVGTPANLSEGFMILGLTGERVGGVFLRELGLDGGLEVFEDECGELDRVRVVFMQGNLLGGARLPDQGFLARPASEQSRCSRIGSQGHGLTNRPGRGSRRRRARPCQGY